MNDRIFGGLTFLLGLFYIYSAFIIEESFISDPVGPKIIAGASVGPNVAINFFKSTACWEVPIIWSFTNDI